MKVGDVVRHKADDEILRVKRVGTNVVTLEEIMQPKKQNIMGKYVFPVRICFRSVIIRIRLAEFTVGKTGVCKEQYFLVVYFRFHVVCFCTAKLLYHKAGI